MRHTRVCGDVFARHRRGRRRPHRVVSALEWTAVSGAAWAAMAWPVGGAASPETPLAIPAGGLASEERRAGAAAADGGLYEAYLASLPRWDQFYALRTFFGYKDNVLLSAFHPEDSAIVGLSLEYFGASQRDAYSTIDIYATVEERRYMAPLEVDAERLAMARASYSRALGGQLTLETPLQYVHLDQVADVSVSEADADIVELRSHSLWLEPTLTLRSWQAWRFEVKFVGQRHWLAEPLDDYWEAGPAWRMGREYGRGSEWWIGYEYGRRQYDTDDAIDSSGALTDRRREVARHEAAWDWRQYWDEAGRWRTRTRASYLRSEDEPGGYSDYNRYRLSQAVRWRKGTWTLEAEGRLYLYDYDSEQTFDEAGTVRRRRREYAVELRCEKRLAPFLQVYGSYEWSDVDSNFAAESYAANTVIGGLAWDF